MGRPTLALNVTTEERRELEAIAASRSVPHGLVRRARMILWSDDGLMLREIARRTKVTPAAVSIWRKRFREERVSGLHDALKSGRRRSHGDERIAELLNVELLRRTTAGTHWTARGLADETASPRARSNAT